MTCQVIAMSLHKLWGTIGKWDHPKWSKVIETITDGAFTKVFYCYSKLEFITYYYVLMISEYHSTLIAFATYFLFHFISYIFCYPRIDITCLSYK